MKNAGDVQQVKARYTLPEVAKMWKVSTAHVKRLIALGGLHAINVGMGELRKLIITQEEIERFEAANTTTGPLAR